MAYIDRLLAADERIKLIAHRHILFLVTRTALYVLGAIALWALAIIAMRRIDTGGEWIGLALFVFSAVPIVIAIYRFLVWKQEQYIVTNYRIIQVEGIVNKRTFDSALEKVNDVLMTQSLFGRTFGYGDIQIITGSEIGVNVITAIADPFAFKRALLEAKMALDGFDSARRREASGAELAQQLATLVDLRDSGIITADEFNQRREQLLGS
jgi:uncharacterized membrane protein YdbT with pleckstrin-like domain